MTNVPKNDYVNVFKPARPAGRHVSEGSHTPEAEYSPSNPLAWGPKGAWGPTKTMEQLAFERQAASTTAYVSQDGFIRDQYTWEARGSQADATFRPSNKNIAPRPKGWTPAQPTSW